jgi:hypothetical protein
MMRKFILLSLFLILSCSLRDLLGPREEESPRIPPPGSKYLTNYTTMQLVGSFQGWNKDDLEGTLMTLVDDWVWERTVYFSAPQEIGFKFVPDQHWDPAFGTAGPDSGLSGPVEEVSGYGTEITAYIPQAGYWKFTFNERILYYWITLEEAPPGGIIGTVSFSDDTLPPYPASNIGVYSSNWDTLYAETQSDTLTGEFRVEGLPDGTYNLTAISPGYLADTITGIEISGGNVVDVGTIFLERTSGAAVIIDGIIDVGEGWIEIAQSEIGDFAGANLSKLYMTYDNLYLYIGFTTENSQSWNVAYGIGLDKDDGGFQQQDTVDAWDRRILFGDEIAVDYEVYFFWNGTKIDSRNLCIWNGYDWDYILIDSTDFAYIGDQSSGLQSLEVRIPWGEIGGTSLSIKTGCWVAGETSSSAVDGAPDDPSLHDSQDEWTDTDILTNFATFEY